MKKLLLLLCCIFIYPFLFLGQNNDTITNPYLLLGQHYDGSYDTTYIPPGSDPYMANRESLENTIWLGDETQGAVPYDAILADDKVYVYGDRRIVVIDDQTKQIINTIDISDYSSNKITRNLLTKKIAEKRLDFDGLNRIFTVTDELEIKVINTISNSIEYTIPKPESMPDGVYHYYLVIKYDQRSDKIYFAINYINNISLGFLFVYDANTYQLEGSFEYDEFIHDIEFNEEHDVCYLSSGNHIFVYNSSSLNLLHTINNGYDFGPIVYINDVGDGIHKVYCLTSKTSGEPIIIDGEDYTDVSTLLFPTTHTSFTTAVYNKEQNKVYASYYRRTPPIETGFCIIDAEDDNQISDMDVEDEPLLNCIDFGEKTVFAGNRNLYTFYGPNGLGLNTTFIGELTFMHGLARDKENPSALYVTNTVDTEVFVFDDDIDLTTTLNVGGHVYYSVVNQTYNKIYFYNKGYLNSTKLFVINTLNQQVNTIDLGFSISAIAYNEQDEKLYVTYFNEENNKTYITSIDGSNDNINTNEIIIDRPKCTGLYWVTGNKLFISVRHSNNHNTQDIIVLDIDTGEQISIPVNELYPSNGTGTVHTNFNYNVFNNKVAISLKSINSSSNDPSYLGRGKIIIVNHDNTYQSYILASPDKILFTNTGDKLFALHKNFSHTFNRFSSINLDDGQLTEYYLPHSTSIPVDFEITPQNLLYISQNHKLYHHEIEVLSCEDGSFQHPVRIEGPVISLKYNDNNQKLYAFVPWNFIDGTLEMQIFGINPVIKTYSKIGLEQFESQHFSAYIKFRTFNHDIPIDNNNKLYLGSGGHSNIKVIDCSDYQDELYLIGPDEWNWLSFPKLQRLNNDPASAIPVLNNLDPMPTNLTMTGRGDEDNQDLTLVKEIDEWTIDGLYELQSTRGYKLMTSNSGTTILPLSGTNLDPTWEIDIFSGYNDQHENWVGYYLYDIQDPFDALVNVMPALKSITGQYWAAANYGTQTHPYWISSKPYPLEYGDMLILKCYYNTSFSWNQPGQSIAGRNFTEPQEFEYEELANYTGFFIELDTTDMPLEIGAFAGDSCIGACVVEPSDTLVLLRGFLNGEPGDSITFEQYYGTKSVQKEKVDQYYVFNTEKQRKERRSIKANENKDFYLVSFKPEGEQSILDQNREIMISVYPNPANDKINIEYTLPNDADVSIELFDLFGRLVAIPESGMQTEGYHTLQWNLKDSSGTKVKPGLYTIRLVCNGTITTKKVLVN